MTNVWRNPIFDRTLDDVEFAIRKITELKQNHTHTTDVRVDNDALVVKNEGVTYVSDNKLVVQEDGIAYVNNDTLIVKVGDVYELKGCLNLLDMNRIEGNIAYLAELMGSYSYTPNIRGKRWDKVDLPNQNDMSRIVENIRALIDAFYSPNNPPNLPSVMLSYTDINAIEENLYLLKEMLDCMQASFKQAGAIKCGSKTLLPMRR